MFDFKNASKEEIRNFLKDKQAGYYMDGKPCKLVYSNTYEPYPIGELAEYMLYDTTLHKFKSQQGKGKRRSRKLLENKEQITGWKNLGISNREIARRLEVSEGTIRNFLKDF